MNDQNAQLKDGANKSKAEYDTKVRELEVERARSQAFQKAAAASSRHAEEVDQQLILRVSVTCFVLHNCSLYINVQTSRERTYWPVKHSLGGSLL